MGEIYIMKKNTVSFLLCVGIIIMAVAIAILEVKFNSNKETIPESSKITDDTSGISLEGILGEVSDLQVTIFGSDSQEVKDVAAAIGDDASNGMVQVYDLTLLDQNQGSIQSGSNLLLTIPIPEEMQQAADGKYAVYHLTSENTAKKLDSYEKGTSVCARGAVYGRIALVKITGEDAQAEAQEPQMNSMDENYYAKASVNVRSGPATTYDIIGTLTIGEQYHITGMTIDQQWYQISYQEQTAYVIATSLSEEAPAANTGNAQGGNGTSGNRTGGTSTTGGNTGNSGTTSNGGTNQPTGNDGQTGTGEPQGNTNQGGATQENGTTDPNQPTTTQPDTVTPVT